MESETPHSFWSTVPGVLTAVAGCISALAALLVAVKPTAPPAKSESVGSVPLVAPPTAASAKDGFVMPVIPDLTDQDVEKMMKENDALRQKIQAEQDEAIRKESEAHR